MYRKLKSIVKHRVSKKYINNILNERDEIFLELGAANKKGQNGWLTIDTRGNCDIFWDLRKGLPFPDNRVAKIYSSHFFEHLRFKHIQYLLDECMRVLLPGGTFSICVPNARMYIEAYLNPVIQDTNKYFVFKPAYNNTTTIDYVNYIAYMNGHHHYMFDEENLLYILESKGFKKVRLRKFDPSLDKKEREFESIYAEAEK